MNKSMIWATLILGATLGMCAVGCASEESSNNGSYPTYSQSCGDVCNGSFCQNMTTGECEGSDLELPCLGTSSGMYCSKSCLSDSDCAGGDRPMSCLIDCDRYPEVAGTCWQTDSADWMISETCS